MLAEALENAKDPQEVAELQSQRTLELARSKFRMANASLTQTRQQRLSVDLADSRQRLITVRRQLAIASQQVQFSQADLDQVARSLDADRRTLEAELQSAEAENASSQQALATARAELQKLQESQATISSSSESAKLREAQELFELRSVQAETSAQRLMVVRQLLELVIQQRGLWQTRFVTFGTKDLSELHDGYRRLQQMGDILTAVRPHFVQQIDLAGRLIAEQRSHLSSDAPQSSPARSQELLDSYKQREQLAYLALRGLGNLERLGLRWRESLDAQREQLPFTGRVRDLFSGMSSFATRLWQFEIFAVEDTITVDGQRITGRRSITVEKIVLALLILALGWWIALFTSGLLERIAVNRFKVERNRATLVRRWTRVLLIVVLIFFSLLSVKIPLTVFAFMGGALAIGLGFGTQNLLKNFISGILILFERPFRVGDVLDIDGKQGIVTGIGIRSSVLQLWNGTEVLIPNSTLLENNLTNWTYSNRYARFGIEVGVAHGSDSRQVSQLLLQSAQGHEQVQKEPTPEVLFSQIGEKQLCFKLRFWVDMQRHNAAQVSSDLRHSIMAALAEHGIELSFPVIRPRT